MLSKENFTEQHIRELQKMNRRDPILLERTVYAFGLLEALVRVKMPFIFKGGTCLMLLLEHPMRLSTDIDIVVEPGTDVDEYIRMASKIFPFVKNRRGKAVIISRSGTSSSSMIRQSTRSLFTSCLISCLRKTTMPC